MHLCIFLIFWAFDQLDVFLALLGGGFLVRISSESGIVNLDAATKAFDTYEPESGLGFPLRGPLVRFL